MIMYTMKKYINSPEKKLLNLISKAVCRSIFII